MVGVRLLGLVVANGSHAVAGALSTLQRKGMVRCNKATKGKRGKDGELASCCITVEGLTALRDAQGPAAAKPAEFGIDIAPVKQGFSDAFLNAIVGVDMIDIPVDAKKTRKGPAKLVSKLKLVK